MSSDTHIYCKPHDHEAFEDEVNIFAEWTGGNLVILEQQCSYVCDETGEVDEDGDEVYQCELDQESFWNQEVTIPEEAARKLYALLKERFG